VNVETGVDQLQMTKKLIRPVAMCRLLMIQLSINV